MLNTSFYRTKTLSFFSKPSVLFVSAATVIIIFAIVITASIQSSTIETFSQVITVGPVWNSISWTCTSDADYTVHATLIAYEENNRLIIFQSNRGTQPDFLLTPLEIQSFTVGGQADSTITITRSGEISGFITLQTTSGATASCTEP